MAGLFDIYALAPARTPESVRQFLDTFASLRDEAAEEYEYPQHAEHPARWFPAVPDVVAFCCETPDAKYTIYWHVAADEASTALVSFLSDGHAIFGLSVDTDDYGKVEAIAARLESLCGTGSCVVRFEEPPPSSTREFLELRKSPAPASTSAEDGRGRRVLAIALPVMGLTIYGMMTKFIPSVSYARFAQYLAAGAALALAGFLAYKLITDREARSRLFEGSWLMGVAMMVLLPLAGFGVVVSSVGWGIPAILHAVVAEDAVETYRVYAPRYAYLNTSASCKGALTIQRDVWFKSRLCRVPEGVYETVSDGDELDVLGRKSIFGFSCTRGYFDDIDATLRKGEE